MSRERFRPKAALTASPGGPTKKKRGRPQGAIAKVTALAIQEAQAKGKLPHEILCDMARTGCREVPVLDKGKVAGVVLVPLSEEGHIAAAGKAAKFYAPELARKEVTNTAEVIEAELIRDGDEERLKLLADMRTIHVAYRKHEMKQVN